MSKSGRRPAALDGATQARIDLARRLTFRIGWKVVAVGLIDFLTLRVWAPDLVNLHQDLALVGGLLCLAVALIATLWLVFRLWVDGRRFALERRALDRARVYEIED